MPRHIACVSFDFDALSLPVARGERTPTKLSQGEFGVVGVHRVLGLLERHGVRATFFIPGHTLRTFPTLCAQIAERGHEVGHHGWTHRPPSRLSAADEEAEMVRANADIERVTGRRARGYRSAGAELSPNTLRLLETHGFVYDSSMMGHDFLPYMARTGDRTPPDSAAVFGTASRVVELPFHWSLDDYPHFEFEWTKRGVLGGLQPARGVLENWSADFDYMRAALDWGVITYTFHPFVIGRGHRLLALDALLRHLVTHGAVSLTMERAAAEAAAKLRAGAYKDLNTLLKEAGAEFAAGSKL